MNGKPPPEPVTCAISMCPYPPVRPCEEPTCGKWFCGPRPMFGERTPAGVAMDKGDWCVLHEGVPRQESDQESLQHERRYYAKKDRAG